jgi:hypothetical protein
MKLIKNKYPSVTVFLNISLLITDATRLINYPETDNQVRNIYTCLSGECKFYVKKIIFI